MLSINAGDDSDEEDGAGYVEKPQAAGREDGFNLSQSGAFTVKDFRINTMGLAPLQESASPAAGASGADTAERPRLNVESIDDLEMLDELGSGMSGTVWSARHKPTGEIVAVKKIQILEKAKRDQAISELRIMRQHDCPWLVSLYNAFYEDTKVYTVLEFMDAGSIDTGSIDMPNQAPRLETPRAERARQAPKEPAREPSSRPGLFTINKLIHRVAGTGNQEPRIDPNSTEPRAGDEDGESEIPAFLRRQAN